MSSTASAAGDVLPALPRIRTGEDARSASPSTAPADAESRPPAEEPTTPTSEESRLHPTTECPPAPRRPAWVAPPPLPPPTPAKRKFPSSPSPPPRRPFFPVTRDLSTVFRALPPKKRIRAG